MVHLAATVSGTIKCVKVSVGETVEDAVKGTVSSVTHTQDVNAHVCEHRWLMMAGANTLGYIAGSILFGSP